MRAGGASSLLPAARRAAEQAGVTRLADITRLDRIGLPVWQAVRPGSRALSVHQGKGSSHEDAQLGALLEAVESDAAERFDAPVTETTWEKLDEGVRPQFLEDFAHDRTSPPPPDMAAPWVEAETPDGQPLMVPLEAVSLDFTRFKQGRFEQASAGLATGRTHEEAARSALLELIERDSVSRFLRARYSERLAREVDCDTVDLAWFETLHETIVRSNLELRVFAPKSPIDMPVFAAVVIDEAKTARPYGGTVGHAAHPDPAYALFKAVSEALQSRLTFISGSRDDCWPWDYLEPQTGMVTALAPPPNVAVDPIDFDEVSPGCDTLTAMIESLGTFGVDQLAFLTIARPEAFHVVRAFAPGLGSLANAARL